jgi:hypothetical protein
VKKKKMKKMRFFLFAYDYVLETRRLHTALVFASMSSHQANYSGVGSQVVVILVVDHSRYDNVVWMNLGTSWYSLSDLLKKKKL